MTDDQFGDPVDGDWPTAEPYTWSPKPTWWARFVEWLIGRREEE